MESMVIVGSRITPEEVFAGQGLDPHGFLLNLTGNKVHDGALKLHPEDPLHQYHLYNEEGTEIQQASQTDQLPTFRLEPGLYCLTIGAHEPRKVYTVEVTGDKAIHGPIEVRDFTTLAKVWQKHTPKDMRHS